MKYWMKGAIYGLILGVFAELNFWNMIGGAILLLARPVQKFLYIIYPGESFHSEYAQWNYPWLIVVEITYFAVLGIICSYIVAKMRR